MEAGSESQAELRFGLRIRGGAADSGWGVLGIRIESTTRAKGSVVERLYGHSTSSIEKQSEPCKADAECLSVEWVILGLFGKAYGSLYNTIQREWRRSFEGEMAVVVA